MDQNVNASDGSNANRGPHINCWPLVFASVVAGVIGGLIVDRVGNIGSMSEEFVDLPFGPSPEQLPRYKAEFSSMYSNNYATHLSIVGAMLGLTIGLVGAVRNRVASLFAAFVCGALAGGLGGYLLGKGTAYCVMETNGRAFNLYGVSVDPFVQVTALQCFAWAMICFGIGVGWMIAIWGFGRIKNAAEAGVICGLVSGVGCTVVAAIMFSNSNGFNIVPESQIERLVWGGVGGLGVGLGLTFAIMKIAKRSAKEAQAE
ncbi:MAG: hypothetical protein ABL921_31595 [Pirellula sp.]